MHAGTRLAPRREVSLPAESLGMHLWFLLLGLDNDERILFVERGRKPMKACIFHHIFQWILTVQYRSVYKEGGTQEARKASGRGTWHCHISCACQGTLRFFLSRWRKRRLNSCVVHCLISVTGVILSYMHDSVGRASEAARRVIIVIRLQISMFSILNPSLVVLCTYAPYGGSRSHNAFLSHDVVPL